MMLEKHVSMPADDVVRICGDTWDQPFDALVWMDGPVVYLRFQEWNGPQDLRGHDDVYGYLVQKTVAGPEEHSCPMELWSLKHPDLTRIELCIPGRQAKADYVVCRQPVEDSSEAEALMDDVVETLQWLYQRLDQRMQVADESTEPDYSEYVWFELEHKNNWLGAQVPFRHQRTDWNSQVGKLTLEHVHAGVLPSMHIPGFEVVRFVRAREDGYDLMDAPWEPAGRLSFLENHENSFVDRRSAEEFLDELAAEYITATHVIMRRV